jgi:hypothetical protein
MTIDIRLRDLYVALGAVAAVVLFTHFAWPKIHPSQPACHDEVYVFAPFQDDDGGEPGWSGNGLPPRRTKFACPHPDQKMELVGHGGITCKCDGYLRSPR